MDRKTFDSKINLLLEKAEQKIPSEDLSILLSMEYLPNTSWHTIEYELWDIGETIRQIICDERKNLNIEQTDRVCKICLNPNAKRGRQSFVMLLGKKIHCSYADRIVKLLQDADVNGHVLQSLYKMGALQYYAEVEPFLNSEYIWIRNLAKKYIEKSQFV